MTDAEFWSAIVQVLTVWAVASIFLERALYQVFDMHAWERLDAFLEASYSVDLKPWISKALSIWLCFAGQFDLFAVVFPEVKEPLVGTTILTGLAVSGGATGVFKALKRLRQVRDAVAAAKINGH